MLTGGLGPTEDDLTRDVVAEVLDRPLHEVAELRQRIQERFARLGRPMPENNLRQAQVAGGRRVAGKPQRHGAGNLD